MQAKTLAAVKRQNVTKGQVHSLRREGMVPGVLYGKKVGSVPVAVHLKELEAILASEGEGVLLQIRLADSGQSADYTALLRDLQRHPIKGTPIHADFYQISMEERMRTEVPLNIIGEPAGLKEGGTLQYGLREIEVECLPADLPEAIEVDVSGLDIGDHLEVGDLKLPQAVRVLTDPRQMVATVVTARAAAAPAPEAEAGEAAQAGEAAKE